METVNTTSAAAATATATATATADAAVPMEESVPCAKRMFPLQEGLLKMKTADPLETSQKSLDKLRDLVKQDPTMAFDVIYANLPWKKLTMDYLRSLPVPDLVRHGEANGMLLWVDPDAHDKAIDLLRHWGFRFQSVLHVVSYEKPDAVPPTTTAAATAESGGLEEETEAPAEETAENEDDNATLPLPVVRSNLNRKAYVPWGWSAPSSADIVTPRSRQLWYAVQDSGANQQTSRYLKDASFIRKRLLHTSSFSYPDENNPMMTTLSAKKKNVENWRIFPEFDVYVPPSLQETIETIIRPTARVLSLFGSTINKSWFTWGPNVPGYFSGPLRTDSGFPLAATLLKYFGNVKTATVHRFLTLTNVYTIAYAKGLSSASDPPAMPSNVESRLLSFITEIKGRAESGGGIRETSLNQASVVQLLNGNAFSSLPPEIRTQYLLLIAQVIHGVIQKSAASAEKRKLRSLGGKRKREAGGTDGEGSAAPPAQRVGNRNGIAKPTAVSSKMKEFLGLPEDAMISRTNAVQLINQYIIENKLQNPSNRQEILLDDRLRDFLRPPPDFGPVTYFNMCNLLKPHYIKLG